VVDETTGAARLAATPDETIERALHALIQRVGEQTLALSFNTAIAGMIEFVNHATAAGNGLTKDQAGRFALVLCPYAPHIAEELWTKSGHAGLCSLHAWPAFDPAKLAASEVEVPVSVNGKVRARLMIPAATARDAKALEAFAVEHAEVKALLGGRPTKKIIAVPGKMVNLVV
jgi:leucyl-tRNA synthetase